MSSEKYTTGKHPHSLANLTYRGGRPQEYGQEKKRRTLTVTEAGWEGATAAIEKLGCNSVSEFLEKLGRGDIALPMDAT